MVSMFGTQSHASTGYFLHLFAVFIPFLLSYDVILESFCIWTSDTLLNSVIMFMVICYMSISLNTVFINVYTFCLCVCARMCVHACI